MEKYSRWRDPGTGIAPFLPVKRLRSAEDDTFIHKSISSFKNNIFGPLISAAKLLVISLIAMIAGALDALNVILIVPFLRRCWRRLVAFLFGRLALALLGFWYIKETTVQLKKGAKDKKSTTAIHPSDLRHGDIIVANHSSYIDLLYLQTFYAPQFTYITSTGTLHLCTFTTAILACGGHPSQPPAKLRQELPLQSLIQRVREQSLGPIVVFPEATTTNGRGLIKFTGVLDSVSQKAVKEGEVRVRVLGIKYEFEDYAVTYTLGGKLSHVIGLGAQFVNRVEVRRVAAEEVVAAVGGEGTSSSVGGEITAAVAGLVGSVARLRMTGLSVKDKAEFFDFFIERESKKRK